MDAEFWTHVAQLGYWVTFLLAAASTLYFVLERGTVAANLKGVTTTAALVSLITAFQYFHMRGLVGFGGDLGYVAPTEFRYLGWILVLPMIILMAQKFLGIKREGAVCRVAFASVVMLAAGHCAEFNGHGWVGFWISVLAWAYIAFTVNSQFVAKGKPSCWQRYIVFGWAVFPLGTLAHVMNVSADTLVIRDLVYTVADVVLVLGFSHCLVTNGRK